MDYRKRFFDNYMTKQVNYVEEISPASFTIVAKGFQKHLSRHLPKDKDSSFLDVACGPGHLLHFLQGQGYSKSQGIDLGNEQLDAAKKMGVKNIQQADLFEYLENCENKFDVVIASQIIEHLRKEEAIQALDLIYGALNPKGKILVLTPNVLSFSGLWRTFGDFTHELVFTPRSLSQLLRTCGFANVNVFGLGPFAHDVRSLFRSILWNILKYMYKICFAIEDGSGRSIWKSKPIFEGILLATGEKKGESQA